MSAFQIIELGACVFGPAIFQQEELKGQITERTPLPDLLWNSGRRSFLELSDQEWGGCLEDHVEAEPAQKSPVSRFDVHPPSTSCDSRFHRVGTIAVATSAPHREFNAIHRGPTALEVIELPLVDDCGVQ